MKYSVFLFFAFLLLFGFRGAGQALTELQWAAPSTHVIDETEQFKRLNCLNCAYEGKFSYMPVYNGAITGAFLLTMTEVNAETVPQAELIGLRLEELPATFELSRQRVIIRKQTETHYSIKALRRNPTNGNIERLLSFRLQQSPDNSPNTSSQAAFRIATATSSVLAEGTWYKIGIVNDGMYKLTPAFLSSLGIPVNSIDPRRIKVYGNGGGMLPEANAVFRFDDLVENPILVAGQEDGSFDAADYVLFYGEGPHKWVLNTTTDRYEHRYNVYADTNYYFITVGNSPGLRVVNATEPLTYGYFTTSYDLLRYHEEDRENLVRTGRKWFGEAMDLNSTVNLSFNLPNLITSESILVRTAVAARSLGATSSFQMRANGVSVANVPVASVSSYYLDVYMREYLTEQTVALTTSSLSYAITYNKPNNFSLGWLDYVEVQGRADLSRNGLGGQLLFRDKQTIGPGVVTRFDVAGITVNDQVWDVTNVSQVRAMPLSSSTRGAAFITPTDSLKTFIAFSGSDFPTPIALGQVANQNLHATAPVDLIIVTHPLFLQQANQLAALHLQKDNYNAVVVTPQQVYNEFSSGRQDIGAIRAFVKMLYDRAPAGEEPRFLLLFGSASYDYKYRINGNANLVPTYQSVISNDPLKSYCADSYFGLLDDNEGAYQVGGGDRMDIAIGRLPAKSTQQAQDMVDKIAAYMDPNNHGDWKNQIMLVADDEDGNLHFRDSDVMSNHINNRYPNAIVKKVYFDGYRQESRPGGTRYPEVNRDINAQMNRGVLMVGYMGHGGINGWAEERVLTIPEIQAWNSPGKYPLMLTATCEFTRYDNPTFTSAGEWVLLNPNGGGIGLLTTTRVTFTNDNFNLSTRIYRDELFKRVNGDFQTLGEVYMNASNPDLSNVNTRNFCLLGDPALTLAFPKEVAAVTQINNVQVSAVPDTIRALALVSISGDVRDRSSGQVLNSYNGILYPTVLDKASIIRTLANDRGSFAADFAEFRNIIYKGRATVANGQWTFSFITPRDIAYNFGNGRINLYATNLDVDAAGDFREVVVGGTDTNFVLDATGPEIKVYMNDRSFVNGSITDQNPVFIAELTDSSGINTVGSGIGRDITLIQNGNQNSPIILNQFYEASLDNYQKGEIRYPFFQLEPGSYQLYLKVWDVFNNSQDADLDFIVAEDAKLAIENLLNYPNPFTTHTTFHFDHNRPNQPLEALLQVYTVSGKLVKSIQQTIVTPGFHAGEIHWDGLDDFGDRIGRGVYVYRIRLRAADGENVQDTQKLVILR